MEHHKEDIEHDEENHSDDDNQSKSEMVPTLSFHQFLYISKNNYIFQATSPPKPEQENQEESYM